MHQITRRHIAEGYNLNIPRLSKLPMFRRMAFIIALIWKLLQVKKHSNSLFFLFLFWCLRPICHPHFTVRCKAIKLRPSRPCYNWGVNMYAGHLYTNRRYCITTHMLVNYSIGLNSTAAGGWVEFNYIRRSSGKNLWCPLLLNISMFARMARIARIIQGAYKLSEEFVTP